MHAGFQHAPVSKGVTAVVGFESIDRDSLQERRIGAPTAARFFEGSEPHLGGRETSPVSTPHRCPA